MEWRLLRSGPGGAAWNMALDEALWRSFPKTGRPILRLYAWSEPAVSIGYAQRAAELDLRECSRLELSLVRRPTGGRAVLHDREVTCGLIHPLEGLGGVEASHRSIATALALGLQTLGLAAEVGEGGKRVGACGSGACFEAPSHSELTVQGRKVAGMAQVRDQSALLEQCSFPLELDYEVLAAVMRPDGLEGEEFISLLQERAAGLREFGPLEVADLERALIAGFILHFGAELEESGPTAEELALAGELASEKYGDPRWNFRR
ncbi:MAG: lipoate--protein ligase family protein [Candidatus Acetothermia bacterium]|jgi:lipoate-protein ligase A|nr:lipoate--protein ligase family protein [Candidatus Acetothermia bacterium]MDH7505574.1 biotin/lipoate A/B protein ligase family protein [Candidatus Acetothermia bacterium]